MRNEKWQRWNVLYAHCHESRRRVNVVDLFCRLPPIKWLLRTCKKDGGERSRKDCSCSTSYWPLDGRRTDAAVRGTYGKAGSRGQSGRSQPGSSGVRLALWPRREFCYCQALDNRRNNKCSDRLSVCWDPSHCSASLPGCRSCTD